MKAKDPETNPLLPVLERIAGALERISNASESLSRIADTVERLEAVSQRYEQLQRIAIWNERYATLETIITPDKLETMKTMIDEFVWKVYREKQYRTLGIAGFEAWLRKILTIQRVYEYMMLTTHLGEWPEAIKKGKNRAKKSLKDLKDEDYAVIKWLREMILDRDFRMVHYRQGAFYPKFSSLVNAVFLEMAERAREKGKLTFALVLARAAEDNGAVIAFDEFNRLPEKDPERLRISKFILAQGEDPTEFESFRLVWVEYPGWAESQDPDPSPSNLYTFPSGEPTK